MVKVGVMCAVALAITLVAMWLHTQRGQRDVSLIAFGCAITVAGGAVMVALKEVMTWTP